MSIDWSKAPEGATHVATHRDPSGLLVFYKRQDGEWLGFSNSKQKWIESGNDWRLVDGVWSFEDVKLIPRPTSTENPVDQPKPLTQAVFDGLPSEYRWAAVNQNGEVNAYVNEPTKDDSAWDTNYIGERWLYVGNGYDTTNWQNSLIERETVNPVSEQNQPVDRKHSHYFKDVSGVDAIDLYHVAKLYEINDPALFHAFKKIACAGKRGSKGQAQDVQEAIDALKRWQELNK